MSPEIQYLFKAALDLPADARAAFVETQSTDPGVRREVLSLLAHDGLAEALFDRAIQNEASHFVSSLKLGEGARIGPYRIVSVLGRGGMGEVYLAERADGSFEQRVAIKSIQSAEPAAFMVDRIQQERRILAHLNHPNIARLLDGGQTADGTPYLVMEYVAGQSLDRFAEDRQLSVAERLALFLKVCDAVQYAHQNLIVHRDLKPANILVNNEGEPKLLDFGIAKVLDPAETGAAKTSTRVLTPEYASPEQVRGDPITTQSDIYSLGAVLYKLLSGRSPHAIEQLPPLEAVRAITERDATPIPGLPNDLNAIVQKAMHKDRARRYGSVEELNGDISRFLEKRPVLAAPDSPGYRTRKFLRRNWGMVAAVAAVSAAVLAGAGVSLWQARRAEQQFADVRRLANTFLFDFEDSIHNLSGATKARLLVVNTANEYLNRLASETSGNRKLERELAEAYKKLGDLQGDFHSGNLGQFQQAVASYRKALALHDSLGDAKSADPEVRANYLSNLSALAVVERFAGDAANGDQLRQKSLELADRWMASSSANANLLAAAASVYDDDASAPRLREQFAGARTSAARCLEIAKRASALDPKNSMRMLEIARGYLTTGYVELDAAQYAAAIAEFGKGNAILDRPLAEHPKDAGFVHMRMVLLHKIGEATWKLSRKTKRDRSAALPFFEESFRIGSALVAEDPANEGMAGSLADLSQVYGSTLLMLGRPADALPLLTGGIDYYSRHLKEVPSDTNGAFNLAIIRVWASDTRRDLHDLKGALDESRKAGEIWDGLLAVRPGMFRYLHQKADNLNTMGNLLAQMGDVDGAHRCFRAGLDIAEKLPKQDASYSSDVVVNELRESEKKLTGAKTR
jgi:eukaryotic-like serine/threonine-protein kinase